MTVGQMIRNLQQFDPDALLIVIDDGDQAHSSMSVREPDEADLRFYRDELDAAYVPEERMKDVVFLRLQEDV